jgi:hypothetical protein
MRNALLVLFLGVPLLTACSRDPGAAADKKDGIKFIVEKTGEPERELERRLEPILKAHKNIRKAYLVVAQYPGSLGPNVTLCLQSSTGEDSKIVSEAADVFSTMFSNQQALDIYFLENDDEAELLKVAKPFYASP